MHKSIANNLPTSSKPLGTYLVDAGLLSPGQVEVILADQKQMEMPFGEIASARGWVKQQTIEYFMRKVVVPERTSTTRPPLTTYTPPQSPQVIRHQNPTPTLPPKASIPNSEMATGEGDEILWVG